MADLALTGSIDEADAEALTRREAIARVTAIARDTFGFDELRPGQAEAMASLVEGRDVLLIMPTGGGKSAVYQVPAVLLQGPTVVISPLIALQRDQVDSLDGRGEATRAYAVSSAESASDRREAFEAVGEGEGEFLFLAPEQLANEDVLARVKALEPSLIAVDEAHCVSSWGHDFRPDYLRLGEFIDALGHPRVIALTATAAPPVRDDIVSRLHLRDPHVIVKGYARLNIALEVVRALSEDDKRDAVITRALTEPKPGIVYTGTRGQAEDYAAALAEFGLRAAAYHGAMSARERARTQRAFTADELDVIVATSAFGMGIDKPDTRFVIHATVPDSPDSYMQEYGRAGRDGKPALAVLYYRPEDLGMRRFFASSVPKFGDVRRVAEVLAATDVDLTRAANRKELSALTGVGPRRLGVILNLLDEVEPGQRRDPKQAARRALDIAESHRTLEETRIEMMRGYAETLGCRRQFLLGYFGEDLPEPCGACDTCASGSAAELAAEAPADTPYPVQSRVRHAKFGEGVVMDYEGGAGVAGGGKVIVLFEEAGYRTLGLAAVREHGLLQPA